MFAPLSNFLGVAPPGPYSYAYERWKFRRIERRLLFKLNFLVDMVKFDKYNTVHKNIFQYANCTGISINSTFTKILIVSRNVLKMKVNRPRKGSYKHCLGRESFIISRPLGGL